MLRHVIFSGSLCCALATSAFASEQQTSAGRASAGATQVQVKVEAPPREGAPAKVRTAAGTFEVREKNADLLRRVIAGDPQVKGTLFAGGR